jgi:hypothetical protein
VKLDKVHTHLDNERRGIPALVKFSTGLQSGMDSSLTNIMGVGVIKKISNFHPRRKKFYFVYIKSSLTFGGEGGAITKNSSIMIYFRFNTLADFGIGLSFRVKEIRWYKMYTIEISLIIFSLSFVFTKYNS